MKKWYSFSENTPYKSEDPSFFDIEKKDWKNLLENNYDIILKELHQLIEEKDKNIIPYPNKSLADKHGNWTIFNLYQWGKKRAENCQKCLNTTSILEQMNGMVSCSFSILKPHSSIKPHKGDSNVMYRCHLTLKCEDTLPNIGMRVRDEKISWENGKLFAFCDAYEHEVWNNTDNERFILIVDILREEFVAHKKQICAEVNATLFWQLKLQNTHLLDHFPIWFRKFLILITSPIYRIKK